MRKHQFWGAAIGVIAAISLAACGKSDDDSPAGQAAKDAETIKAGEAQWVSDLKAKDVEKVVSHYASSAVLLEAGQTPTKGGDQLRWVFKQAFSDPNFSLEFKPDRVEIAAAGDIAYSQGTYSEAGSDAVSHQAKSSTGAYVTVYRKAANGDWKAIEDIVTPTATAPAGPTGKPAVGKAASSSVDVAAEADALRALETEWQTAWKSRDAGKVASYYTSDAVVMQPGLPGMVGAPGITAGLTEALKDPAFALEFKADQVMVSTSGDLAYTRGSFTVQCRLTLNPPSERRHARCSGRTYFAAQDISSPGPEPLAPVAAK